jgi:hypothetical protein
LLLQASIHVIKNQRGVSSNVGIKENNPTPPKYKQLNFVCFKRDICFGDRVCLAVQAPDWLPHNTLQMLCTINSPKRQQLSV